MKTVAMRVNEGKSGEFAYRIVPTDVAPNGFHVVRVHAQAYALTAPEAAKIAENEG